MSASWFDEVFDGQLVMAILRGYPVAESVQLANTAWELGFTCVEVPIQDDDAVEALRAVVAAGAERGHPVGAGTVTSREHVVVAHACGAAFTVAPGLDPEVLQLSTSVGLPHLPGVATPTDIQRALALDVGWLKAFPATVLGTEWFRAMSGPFPTLRLVATGGITPDNAQAYLDAGASVVAVGSSVAVPASLERLAGLKKRPRS